MFYIFFSVLITSNKFFKNVVTYLIFSSLRNMIKKNINKELLIKIFDFYFINSKPYKNENDFKEFLKLVKTLDL